MSGRLAGAGHCVGVCCDVRSLAENALALGERVLGGGRLVAAHERRLGLVDGVVDLGARRLEHIVCDEQSRPGELLNTTHTNGRVPWHAPSMRAISWRWLACTASSCFLNSASLAAESCRDMHARPDEGGDVGARIRARMGVARIRVQG